MATSICKVWNKKSATITASSVLVIDTLLLSSFNVLDYILNFKNSAETQTKSLKLNLKRDDSSLSETINNVLGALDVSVTPKISGSSYELEITNNESFDIKVDFARATI